MTMRQGAHYRIHGPSRPLQGTAFVQGAKNAALPMIAAALLAPRGRTVLHNVPLIDDVRRAAELARAVGATVEFHEPQQTMVIDASTIDTPVLPSRIAGQFRGSVLFIPALLHRLGEAVLEDLGGCNLGSRNLDFHYRGFVRLGAAVQEDGARIRVKASQLHGAPLYLDTPSHTGTENLIAAASLAQGTTVVENAAQEPEVLDFIKFLTLMGARIRGQGTGYITVEGVDSFDAVEYTIMPDRIDTGVLAIAAAAVGGQVSLVGAKLEDLGIARWKLEQMGVELEASGAVLQVRRAPTEPLRPINVVTTPHPGFATDLQSPLITLACLAQGTSYVRERIYDARYALAEELPKLGADIRITDNAAVINGPASLHGGEVVARDLRTGIALILAGLAAVGETVVTPAAMIERGHAQVAERLGQLGADITRVPALGAQPT